METSNEEEVERLIKAAPLPVGAGEVEAAGVNVKCLGVFMEVLEYTKIFKEVGPE